jgi:hypothetical protein
MAQFTHIEILLRYLKNCLDLDGIIGEFGCRACATTGKISNFLKENNSDKTIYAFDTFEGFPYDDILGTHKKGMMATDYKQMQESAKKHGNIKLVKGMFEDTLEKINKQYCFAFIDPNVYQAAHYVYHYINDKMVKGGMMIFHDYGSKNCPGIEKIVDKEVNSREFELIFTDKRFENRLAVFRRIRTQGEAIHSDFIGAVLKCFMNSVYMIYRYSKD